MAIKFPVQAVITAVDKISGPVKRIASTISGRLNRVLGKTKRLAGKATRSFGRMAAGITKFGVAAGAAGLAASVKQFGELSLNIARIGTLLPESRDAMADFGEQVKSDAVKFGQSTAEVADAIFQGISAGVDPSVESIQKFNQVVGEASAGGFTDMATVVDGLTTVMNAFGLESDQARTVSDAFFIANRDGKTTFEELSGAIGAVAPTASALGVTYRELLAATVSLTKGGLKTDLAMTGIRAVLSSVAKPAADAEKAAKRLGITLGAEGIKGAGGLAKFLQILVDKTKGSTTAQIALFGNVRAFNAVARLASTGGIKDFNTSLASMKGNSNATGKAFKRVSGTVGFKVKQMKSTIGAFLSATGGGVFAGLGFDAGQDATGMLEKVTKAGEGFGKRVGAALAAIDWEAVLAALSSMVGLLGSIAGALSKIEDFGGILSGVTGSKTVDPFAAVGAQIASRSQAPEQGNGTGAGQAAKGGAQIGNSIGRKMFGGGATAFTGKMVVEVNAAPGASAMVKKAESSNPAVSIGAKVGRRIIGRAL